jgi:hypothetical protein
MVSTHIHLPDETVFALYAPPAGAGGMKRTPLKPKRATPRRNEGRVNHGRIKEKVALKPTTEEIAHREMVREVGCLVCGKPAETHHVIECGGWKTKRRDHRVLTPLCGDHHRGPAGAHGLSEARFEKRYGFKLLSWGLRAWENRKYPGTLHLDAAACWQIATASELRQKGVGYSGLDAKQP